MRSFPGREDDNIEHEILIATDGCLTSLGYYFTKGLNTIRRRGIKVSTNNIFFYYFCYSGNENYDFINLQWPPCKCHCANSVSCAICK